MPSSHFILGRPLLLLPPIPPSIRVFSSESILHMRWPKYWSFSFSILLLSRVSRVRLLCDPIDGSPPGSTTPGILQARTLEWVAVSFPNARMHVKSLQLCPSLWRRYGQQPTRLLRPWDFPGKSTGVGCYCLLLTMYSDYIIIF